ncbi:MAG: methyltransferase domain-containing protein [Rhodomicrobium sp.]
MLLSTAMYDDAARLRDFYASPLGQLSRRIIARRIRDRWPNVAGMDVIGLGYASPYLRMFYGEARTTAALMPQSQGVVQWPHKGPYRSALVGEIELPLRDNSVECVLAVHGLEHVEARQDYLREIWRVLMPQGRVIVVVPNRRGAWARFETTPFGHGRPYSSSQIERLLREASLEPVGVSPCLFAPPFRARALPFAALAWERIGMRLWPAFAGVMAVEAIKQVYRGVKAPVKKPAFVPVPALSGLSAARRDGRVGR